MKRQDMPEAGKPQSALDDAGQLARMTPNNRDVDARI